MNAHRYTNSLYLNSLSNNLELMPKRERSSKKRKKCSMKKNNKYEILTSEGFKDFDGVKRSKHHENIKFYFEDSDIIVSKRHLFKVQDTFIEAQYIKVNDILSNKKVLNIENNVEYDDYFYDPVEVKSSDSSYIANNIEHHNCLYVDECIEEDSSIDVLNYKINKEESITVKELYSRLSDNQTNTKYKIKTINGYKGFAGIKKVQNPRNIKIYIKEYSIIVTPKHKFLIDNKDKIFKEAEKLKIKDNIYINGDLDEITNIEYDTDYGGDFYDLIEVEDGHHYTANGFENSNCAFIKSTLWDDFADSVFPAQDALAEKQTIISSTPSGLNHYYHMVKGAEEGVNGYELVSCHWTEVPRWNKDGTLKDPEQFKSEQVAKNGEVFWNQNFGAEFIGSSNTLVSGEALKSISVTSDDDIIFNSIFKGLRVFEEPVIGNSYILALDPKKDGADEAGVHVIDVTSLPFKQVASANLQESYLTMPGKIFDLGNYYNKAMVVVENNIDNSIVDNLFYQYEYEGEIFKERDGKGRSKKILGFRTTIKTKRQILSLLKKFIEEGKLVLKDLHTVDQLFNFIEQKNGTYSAESGYKDDLVMALAIMFAPFIEVRSWDDYKGFIALLEKTAEEEELEQEDLMAFINLGISDTEYVEEAFTPGVWDDPVLSTQF